MRSRIALFSSDHAFSQGFVFLDAKLILFEEKGDNEQQSDKHAQQSDVPEESEGKGLRVVDVGAKIVLIGEMKYHQVVNYKSTSCQD